jgi:mono/diheme cytochrome c family protein
VRTVFGGIAAVFLLLGPLLGSNAGAEEPYSGRDEFMRYCSACHGEEADGNGPVANVLTPRPPPLTTLRTKYGNPLSTRLVGFVSGTMMPRAHGTSDMPVWGKVLRGETGDERKATEIIWRIVHYLDGIQVRDVEPAED